LALRIQFSLLSWIINVSTMAYATQDIPMDLMKVKEKGEKKLHVLSDRKTIMKGHARQLLL
jgi:hypothetical protein